MKALIVITKAGIGGAQTFVSVLAKGLKRLGADVCVLTGEGGELTEGLDREKIPSFFCPHLRRSGNPVAAIRFVIALRKIIDEQAINVLHLNSSNALPGVWAAILSRSKPKTVFTVHGLSVLDANYRASAIVKRLYLAYYRFFFRYVDQVVFVSKYNQEEAGKIGLGQRSTVIYNGLDLASDHFLGRAEARRRLGEMAGVDLTDAFIIGSVGRLSRQKNYNFLIGVWPEIKKIYPRAKLMIIGEGPERKSYERLVAAIGGETDIFLPGESNAASRLLTGFDLFVLPSIYEGLPISLIEARLAGVRMLASDVGGNREVVGADNCYLLDDKAKFLEKLGSGSTIASDEGIFWADNMVKRYWEIYAA